MDQDCRFCSAESQSCGNLNWGQIPESVGIDMKLCLATLSLEESLKTLFVSGLRLCSGPTFGSDLGSLYGSRLKA